MNRIEHEIGLLLSMAASGELPQYPSGDTADTFYTENRDTIDFAEYFSGENDALELQLKALWADDPELKQCIPLVLAAVEKSRGQEDHAIVHTELYNYTM